jgi:hypothetical protein
VDFFSFRKQSALKIAQKRGGKRKSGVHSIFPFLFVEMFSPSPYLSQKRRDVSVLNYVKMRGSLPTAEPADNFWGMTGPRVGFVNYLLSMGWSRREAESIRDELPWNTFDLDGFNHAAFQRFMIARDNQLPFVMASRTGAEGIVKMNPRQRALLQLVNMKPREANEFLTGFALRGQQNVGLQQTLRMARLGTMTPAMQDVLIRSRAAYGDYEKGRGLIGRGSDVLSIYEEDKVIAIPDAMSASTPSMPLSKEDMPVHTNEGDQFFEMFERAPIQEGGEEPITADLAMSAVVGEKRAREIEDEIDDAAKRAKPEAEMSAMASGAEESKEMEQVAEAVDEDRFADVIGAGDLFNRTSDPFDEFGN